MSSATLDGTEPDLPRQAKTLYEHEQRYAREQLSEAFGDTAFADGALNARSAFIKQPERITATVEEVTGVPARTFAQWALDHARGLPMMTRIAGWAPGAIDRW